MNACSKMVFFKKQRNLNSIINMYNINSHKLTESAAEYLDDEFK